MDPISLLVAISAAIPLAGGVWAALRAVANDVARFAKTPDHTIANAPEGMRVQIRGTALPAPHAGAVAAPLTGRPALCVRARLEVVVTPAFGHREQQTYLERTTGDDFLVRDDAGDLALVKGADVHLVTPALTVQEDEAVQQRYRAHMADSDFHDRGRVTGATERRVEEGDVVWVVGVVERSHSDADVYRNAGPVAVLRGAKPRMTYDGVGERLRLDLAKNLFVGDKDVKELARTFLLDAKRTPRAKP